ncbi:uncharacterized protein LOC134278649 [Saccostrea cucullata]|uniref:uncharacterized protein LOC134278649 n=1 Tax=Saccostrea cuccullata TaxID=36930 RepID=UPI002ED0B04B
MCRVASLIFFKLILFGLKGVTEKKWVPQSITDRQTDVQAEGRTCRSLYCLQFFKCRDHSQRRVQGKNLVPEDAHSGTRKTQMDAELVNVALFCDVLSAGEDI